MKNTRSIQKFLVIVMIQRVYFFQAEIDEEYKEYKEFSGVFAEGIVKGKKNITLISKNILQKINGIRSQ